MSASSKKKLRKEAVEATLTEKQKTAQAEAKKTKAMTVSFVVIMLVMVLSAAAILTVRGINNSGIIERNTIAAVVNGENLDSVQMNYYYIDHIQNMHQQWENLYGENMNTTLSFMGLNMNAPLDEQQCTMADNMTWAEYFLDGALEKARTDYALYQKATAEGFKLSEEDQTALESGKQMLQIYAIYGGYKSADKYLQAIYGYGSSEESYTKYSEISAIATAYYNQYSDSLTYTEAAIDEYGGVGSEKFDNFSSFSYAVYSVNVNDYLTGGVESEDGNITYSDDEKAAAQKKAEEIANQLKATGSLDALDKAISELEINKDKETSVVSTKNDVVMYTNLSTDFQKWLADKERKADDITVIPNESTSTDANGNTTKTLNGYYVLVFMERNDNERPLANVRHLLVQFDGGTTDANGNKTYSDTEKATAKAEAEKYLQEWKDGAATQDSFIELVKQYSDDSSKDTGGLFEDIHPESPYVESFLAWSLDTDRKAGDTGVIISDYGYHVMYYVGDDELTYRDYMIQEELRTADVDEWYSAITEPVTATIGDTKRLNLGVVMANVG